MSLKVEVKKILDDFKLDVNFALKDGLSVLFGKSGAGKSITLRMIAGLLMPDTGMISLGNEILFCAKTGVNLLPQERRMGYFWQNHALFPHMTVWENIMYGAKRCHPRKRQTLARKLITKFKLKNICHKYPHQISGGQQQKVVFARTVISKPQFLLLDEPFSALDAMTRMEVRVDFKTMQREFKIPTIFVTHDIYEAYSLADEILVIEAGKIVQTESI